MTAPHGILQVGRSYASGTRAGSTSNAQDRRIVQEVFRDLAQYVPGVDVEMLVDSLKDGLSEDGINIAEMSNLLKFYDAVRDRLVGQSGVVQAEAPSLVDIGAMPSIIRELTNRRGADAAYIPTSYDEDRQLVAAALESRLFRAALMSFGNAEMDEAREAVRLVLDDEGLSGDMVAELLRAFEEAQHPGRAAKRRQIEQKRAELERVQRELAALIEA